MAAGGAEVILLKVMIVLIAAKIGGEIAERLKQSSVLGELLAGVLIGPSVFGLIETPAVLQTVEHAIQVGSLDTIAPDRLGQYMDLHVLQILAEIGVILLLFEVGLESDIKELVKVGPAALLVGLIGIVGSFVAGYGGSWVLGHYGIWSDDWVFHTFIGATLTATSVGITARVLADMGKLNTDESRIILGAAVFDDIGGLMILAIVSALAAGDALTGGQIGIIILKAVGFLAVAVGLGILFIPQIFDKLHTQMQTKGATLTMGIIFMLLMAYLAGFFGLAPIVGAFAGGLILAQAKCHHHIFQDIKPIGAILIPFFFVMLGVQVDLGAIGGQGLNVLIVGIGLTIIAIVAKLASGWGVVKSDASKLVVGVGMVPRGEVGLIFALVGFQAGLMENWMYTAVIVVVMLTTFITPIWLKSISGRMHVRGSTSPHAEAAAEITKAS